MTTINDRNTRIESSLAARRQNYEFELGDLGEAMDNPSAEERNEVFDTSEGSQDRIDLSQAVFEIIGGSAVDPNTRRIILDIVDQAIIFAKTHNPNPTMQQVMDKVSWLLEEFDMDAPNEEPFKF